MRSCSALPDGACFRRGPFLGRRSGRWGGGGLSPAQRADKILDLVTYIGGAPTFQFRADTVSLSSGNVATIPNRRGSDALVLAAGTLAAPASDALFGGAQSIAFSGTQWLDSNLAASAWKFLHDGTGCEVFLVYSCPTSAIQCLWSTHQNVLGASSHGARLTRNGTPNLGYRVSNGSTLLFTHLYGPDTNGAATYADNSYSETTPLKAQSFQKEASRAVDAVSGSPSSSNAEAPLRLGACVIDNSLPSNMKFAELLIFPRVLHEYERQLVREYIAARYGIAAPSLTGADREIMSMLPFSWLDVAAHNTSGGKVTVFLDRARPGHTFAQGTSGNQVVDPVTAADFNNQLVATFVAVSATRYISTLASAAWSFLASQQETFHVLAPLSLSSQVFCTQGTSTRYQHSYVSSGNVTALVTNGGTTIVSATAAAALAAGAPTYLDFYFQDGRSPNEYAQRVRGTVANSGDSTSAPGGSLDGSLCIGSTSTGTAAANMRLAGSVFFNRVLSDADRAKMQSAILSKWGLAT